MTAPLPDSVKIPVHYLQNLSPEKFRFLLEFFLAQQKRTQRSLAKQLGTTPRVVSTWMRGSVDPPATHRLGVIVALVAHMELRRDYWVREQP